MILVRMRNVLTNKQKKCVRNGLKLLHCHVHFGERDREKLKMFAEATKKAAGARFKKRQLDSEGQEIEVRHS
jgi:hypothetical protein